MKHIHSAVVQHCCRVTFHPWPSQGSGGLGELAPTGHHSGYKKLSCYWRQPFRPEPAKHSSSPETTNDIYASMVSGLKERFGGPLLGLFKEPIL